MKYLNTIEAKGGVLFDALKDFTFDEARQGFLYFDDNILGDSTEDGVITTPALKVKIYENPNSTGYIPPSKTNFHYVLTSYLSKDVNHTGSAVAGGILKASTSDVGSQDLPLSKAAATLLKKDTANTMRELRRVNLEQGRITNAQIVPIYDSELVTKKWVESKLGSFTLQANAAGLTYLDSTTHTAELVMEASQADYVFEAPNTTELTAFIDNAIRSGGEEDGTRQITHRELSAADPIIVFVNGEIIIGVTKYNGSYRVASAAQGNLVLEKIPVPVWFKEPTYALSVYELSTDNYSKDGAALRDIRFNLTATGVDSLVAEAAGTKMMDNNSYSGLATGAKIAGAADVGKFARVTCIAETGTTTFLTYKCSQTTAATPTAPAVVKWDVVPTSGVSRSYKQVFPDIAFIEATVAGSDPLFKLQLGFANPLANGAKFYVAFAG